MAISSIGTTSYSSTYASNNTKAANAKCNNATQKAAVATVNTTQTDTSIHAFYEDNIMYNQGEVDSAKAMQYSRTKITESLNMLLTENGIEIPQGTSLTFSIKPYDYKLTVSGSEDKALTTKIEDILNSGDTATNLFYHICYSSIGNNIISEQHTMEKSDKLSLFRSVKENTGYDLRDCISKDGTFYAPDGTDVIAEFMKGSAIPAAYRSDVISAYAPRLRELARNGFDSVPDMIMQIEYKNGNLYDIGQKNGFGPEQTGWIDNLVAKYGDGLFVKPVREVKMDSNTPAISELLKQNGIELPKGTTLTFSFIANRNFLSVLGTDNTELLAKLQYLFFQPASMNLLQYLSQPRKDAFIDVSV